MKKLLLFLVLAVPLLAQQPPLRVVTCADAGASDTYTCSASPTLGAYVTGQVVLFTGNTANTGAASLNIDSLGAKTIVKLGGGITTALADNDIRANQRVILQYDGTNFQMLSQVGNAAAGGGGLEIAANAEGAYFPFGEPQTQTAAGAQTALRTYIKSFILPFKMNIDAIGFRVQTAAGSAATGITVGIYDSTCSTLLLSGNRVSNNTANLYATVTFTNTALPAGNYFIAWATDDTTMQLSSAGVVGMTGSLANLAATPQYFFGTASTGSGATVTLPASCGTRTAVTTGVSLPHFMLIP